MRSMQGAETFCAIRSYLATAAPPWHRLVDEHSGRRNSPSDGLDLEDGELARPKSRQLVR
jgi:hypothetical protein